MARCECARITRHRWTHGLHARTQWHVACARSGDRQRPYGDCQCWRDLALCDTYTIPKSCFHWYAYGCCRGHCLLKLFLVFSHMETSRSEITNRLEMARGKCIKNPNRPITLFIGYAKIQSRKLSTI